MAHIMTKRGNLDNIVTYQHICDTTADLSNISQEYCTLGSIAIVIEGEGGGLEIYITNSNKQWIPLTISSASSGEEVTLAEVNELIANALGNITGFNTQIVNELPVSDINAGTIYLVANNNGNDNGYDEYIYVNNNWQKIGSTANIRQLYNIRDGHGLSSIEEGDLSSSGGVLATGKYSHAEGQDTIASGDMSHAEGSETTASGSFSHAEGNGTIANHKSQHVFGSYNIADDNINLATEQGTYIEIVGNGDWYTRSNARTLDWNGNQTLAGTLTISSNGITIGNTTLTEAQLQSIFTRLAALEQAAPASGNNANYLEVNNGYIGG